MIDPGLVRSAQRGDVLAADQLLACLEPIVRRACDAVDPSRGDDATQDTLLVVFRQLRDLRAPEAIVTWARTVAAREAMRGARADRRHGTPTDRELLVAAADTATDPMGLVELIDALEQLDPGDRSLLVAKYLDGRPEREIAHALGVPVGTVKSRLHRARLAMKGVWR